MKSRCFFYSFPPPVLQSRQNPFLRHRFPHFPPLNLKFKLHCNNATGVGGRDDGGYNNGSKDHTPYLPPLSGASSAYAVLGVDPGCSAAELKAAFRAKVKKFHPDVNRDVKVSDTMIRRVLQAYEILSNCSRSEIIESECLDPFEEPECEAFDIFVNEVLCVGRGCPYSCVKRAAHAFTYASSTGTARATSQGHGEDYQVQLAVGQCPRSCIHYVTPSQRIILEELLDTILTASYDSSAEADLLYSLVVKARFENNRFRKPKKQPKSSTQHADWF